MSEPLPPEAVTALERAGLRKDELNPETLARIASRYPLVIPDLVIDRLKRYFAIDPADALSRPLAAWGGKSAIQSVADGDRTWDAILAHYDDLFRWDYRG